MIDKVIKPVAALLILLAVALAMFAFFDSLKDVYITVHREPAPQPQQVIAKTTTTTKPTTITTTEPARGPYYALTEYERDLVERVVMAEAGAEPYKGQMAVAQCILNACQLRRAFPAQVVVDLDYTKARPEPTDSVKRAVSSVFDDGATVFSRDVLYFYAPAMTTSSWHESQEYVMTIGGHRFFKEAR